MAEPPDPFTHHPELRDKIEDPAEAAFYRTLNIKTLFADKPELQWVIDLLYSDETREQIRRDALAAHLGGDLWVFGYGSLMWNPAIHFTEVRRATLSGHARRFILKDTLGGRGTREAPGLMAALDVGGLCEGLVFRIREEDIETETEILWRRECIMPAYLPRFVTAEVEGAPVRALTFIADRAADALEPDLSFEEQVHLIATGTGFLGSSRDYLASIVDHFAALGIHDEACVRLLTAVDKHPAPVRETSSLQDGAPGK